MWEIFAGLGLALIALAAHPFLTYAPSLAWLRRRHGRPISPIEGWRPSGVAVCVCAYNEAATIAGRVENLLAARAHMPDLDIAIYVDGASDGTMAALAPYAGRIRIDHCTDRHGKTFGMNRLVAGCDAEIIVFSDANVCFASDAIPNLLAPFADPEVGCVCGHLQYDDGTPGHAAAKVGSFYWRLEERIKALESDTGSVMGADGSIFAIRRSLHTPPPPDLIDDMFVSFSVLLQGKRIVRAADAVANEPPVAQADEEFRRKIRIACQAMNVHRALWPHLRRMAALDLYKYVSHKWLRWHAAYLAGAGVVFLLLATAMAGFATLALAGLLLTAAAGYVSLVIRPRPFATLTNIALALVATAIGVAQSFRGLRFQTWTPPATARLPLHSGAGD